MREYKFRFWDKETRVMLNPLNHHLTLSTTGFPLNLQTSQGGDDYIVTQYTGLKDKNGKEIYEGDVVHIKHPHKNRKWMGEVIYNEWLFTGKGFWFTHFDQPNCLFSEGTEYIEVIGNIYENPELLENADPKT